MPKADRFNLKDSKKASGRIYNIPDTLGGRKVGIGYGNKSPITRTAVIDYPSPLDYNFKGFTDDIVNTKGIGIYNKPVGIVSII